MGIMIFMLKKKGVPLNNSIYYCEYSGIITNTNPNRINEQGLVQTV